MRSGHTSWFKGSVVRMSGMFVMALSISAAAQSTGKKQNVAKPASDKVDISDIESKYWAPKDTDFNVVQNRTYSKDGKIAISLLAGPLTNDSFNEGLGLGVSVNYFLSERYGLQLDYVRANLNESDAVDVFRKQGGFPNYGRLSNYYGIGFNWIPVYAKMSLLGSKIIYFDMAFTPTLGMVNYDKKNIDQDVRTSALGYGFDITQYFFLSKHFALRFDYKNIWYNEQIAQFQSDPGHPTGSTVSEKTSHINFLLFGATFYF